MFCPTTIRRGGILFLVALVAAACSSGTSSNPIGNNNVPPELLACRARVDSPSSFAEIALRSAQNLGTSRIADRSGTERDARLHPDGNTVVFARERSGGNPDSDELYVAVIDGSRAELRLTANNDRDHQPCWSPDGSQILFVSERNGATALWLVAPDGSDARLFLAAPAGERDGQPDWSRASNRIVFSRRDAQGKHRLYLAEANGTGVMPLTDGGPGTGLDTGDFAPSFSPDGGTIAFVRQLGASTTTLCLVDVASTVVTPRFATVGAIDLPRFAPTMDRLFFGLAEPLAGRASLRLASLPIGSGEPTLLWPDERWQLEGLDILPALTAAPAANPPELLDVTKAQLQLAFGTSAFGSRNDIADEDGLEFRVLTATNDFHEVGGINVRFDLPVADPEDVLELRVRAVARVLRTGGDTALRMSIYNPVDERFDTAVEVAPGDTTAQTMTFRTSSLRHVTRERQVRITVVGEIADGPQTELRVDLVEVTLVTKVTPP
ncbi:MAG: PD40 domain-containing protein [Planctomycetes bacterium]|nr:PD40 domain-containing protein [Planctomycetota bacterium]MCB9885511.1 PD40 domain-containing protein [Planctomycetota bacterium]